MTQPSFSCPRCGYETYLPSDVRASYCPSCQWWTGDSLLGSEDVLTQAEIDGPFATAGAQSGEVAAMRRIALRVGDVYCGEHDLVNCWYAHETRAEVETDWFGAPVACDLEADLEESFRDPAFRASYEAAETRSAAARTAPTFRVARFVQALRRLRNR